MLKQAFIILCSTTRHVISLS